MKNNLTKIYSVLENRVFLSITTAFLITVAVLLLVLEGFSYWSWQKQRIYGTSSVEVSYQLNTNVMVAVSNFNPNCFFAPADISRNASTLSISQRYRLAGTFIMFSEDTENEKQGQTRRLAILDDIRKGEQILVQEGAIIPNTAINVEKITAERIILKEGEQEEELTLCFTQTTNALTLQPSSNQYQRAGTELNIKGKYGIQVESNRWVLSREKLVDYYQELLNNTERLAKIYDSLKPVYADNGQKITGYVLDIEGEAETFKELGLRQGDIVRRVNSMAMTSQKRAEYFLRELVKNRINGFVIEIERDGKTQNLIYLIR